MTQSKPSLDQCLDVLDELGLDALRYLLKFNDLMNLMKFPGILLEEQWTLRNSLGLEIRLDGDVYNQFHGLTDFLGLNDSTTVSI